MFWFVDALIILATFITARNYYYTFQSKRPAYIVVGIGSVIWLTVMFFSWEDRFKPSGSGLTQEERAAKECENSVNAHAATRPYVRATMHNPSSAKFARPWDQGVSIVYLGNCEHRVNSWVEGTNAFGATVRNHYSVRMKYDKETNQWTALESPRIN